MDYKTIDKLMESGIGGEFCQFIQNEITALRDKTIDHALPAAEYKSVSIGRDEAIHTLTRLLHPFLEHQHIEKKKKSNSSIYYTHEPKV
jgi:hypothetical protein